ncbi:Flp family type IVb pilin [Novosphingobium profundi]|uniref:Flp family type IVb pilin n=1 Tax=Novosphingobium profundi TaxID=1774954 RepID=UPI001FEBF153|nr:Flp family type IVb pilin [Novosphingobium profundi]
MKHLKAAWRDKAGATAVEYGLILAMVVLVIVFAIQGVADQTIAMWGDVNSKSSEAMAGN